MRPLLNNKEEIKTIYEAYGQRFIASWSKVKLNGIIVEHIKVAGSFVKPDVFDNCQKVNSMSYYITDYSLHES